MSTRNGRVARLRTRSDVGEALMDAADAIADMAQRVQLNGPEPTYASEKLVLRLFKAAEGLALCDVELEEVTEEARRGHRHGRGSRRTRDDAQRSENRRHRALRPEGRVFYAIVVERHERELEVDPIDRRVTYRRVKAREVLGIWRKSRAQNGRVVEAAEAGRMTARRAQRHRRSPPRAGSWSSTSRTRSTTLAGRGGAATRARRSRASRRWTLVRLLLGCATKPPNGAAALGLRRSPAASGRSRSRPHPTAPSPPPAAEPELTPPRRAPTCRLSAVTTNFSPKEACMTQSDPGARDHAPPGTERLLAGLTPEQAQAVTHGTGPLLLLAGPGAGKTRTLTHRAAYLLASGRAQPWEILAVTFSVRAAGELRLRLADLLGETVARGVTAATFHSVCARLLREHASVFGRTERYTIYDQADMRRVIDWLLSDAERGQIQRALADYGQPASAEVLAEISRAKNRAAVPGQLRALRGASGRAADRRGVARERVRAAALQRVRVRRPARVRGEAAGRAPAPARVASPAVAVDAGRRVPGHQPRAGDARRPARRPGREPVRVRR